MARKRALDVFIVSDATGTTSESVFTSVGVQFPSAKFKVQRFPFVRDREKVDEVLGQAPEGECVVIFTMVSQELRDYLLRGGKRRGLTMVDVMGTLIGVFSRVLEKTPKMTPGVLHHEDEETLKLTDAIQFAMKHDDGQGVDDLEGADLIIFGPSRTGKTPTSIFLSCRKLKVANIPIVPDQPVPEAVKRLPVKKVGFVMSVERLQRLRAERSARFAAHGLKRYSSEEAIFNELERCREIYDSIPRLKVLDVTNRSIEETAGWISRNVL